MCQQILQFCSGSTKPLLFVGSFLLLLSSIAIGYTGCTANALYQDIDVTIAQQRSLAYYLQLAAAAYLALITVLASLAAHYDQKHSIGALSVVTSINFVLAAIAIILIPSGPDVGKLVQERLQKARDLYDFKERFPVPANYSNSSTINEQHSRLVARWTDSLSTPDGASDVAQPKAAPLNSSEATRIWDRLQSRGCCGFSNATTEWTRGLPKSCCANPEESAGGYFTCKLVDAGHSRPCIDVIESTGLSLWIVSVFIALVNLYLAGVTGISAYRTFHYNEASQNAYT